MFALTLQAFVAVAITTTLIPALDRPARRLGFTDRPNGCKARVIAIPVTGGIAMFVGVAVSMAALGVPGSSGAAFLVGLGCFVAVGVVDDLINLHPCVKLAGQIAAALVMIMLGQNLIGPGHLLGMSLADIPIVNGLTTIILIAGLANAFNLLDGIDGLAGAVAATALAYLATMAASLGMAAALSRCTALLAATLGFLFWNMRHPWRRTAVVYMGDAGSLMLGAAIASLMPELAVAGGDSMQPSRLPVVPVLLWLVALPAFDTLILIARRLASGRNPLRGDHNHIHHVLLQHGFPVSAATPILAGVCCIYGATGLFLWHMQVPNRFVLAALAVPFAAHISFVLNGRRVAGQLQTAANRPSVGPATLAQPEAGLP